MAKKYAGLDALQTFLDNIKTKFSQIGHKHTLSDLTDYTVDDALSSTSVNPVQNKVLDAEFNEIAVSMRALDLALDGKSDSTHDHNDKYYQKSEVDSALSSKSDSTHNHNDLYDTKGAAADSLASANSYTDNKTANLISTSAVDTKISTHNTATTAHNDIRDLITNLTTRLNTLANSDDTTLDQLSEIVTYIKNNKSLIDGITTSKVNVSDIINNLTTNVTNKPLSAAQGVAIQELINNLQTELDSHGHVIADVENLQSTLDAKASKTEFDTHNNDATKHIDSIERSNWNTAATNVVTAQSRADSAYALAESKVDSLSDLGITATAAELNYMSGVTSNVQEQLDGKANLEHTQGADSITISAATAAQLGFAMGGETTLPSTENWSSIAFGDGKFVAPVYNTDKVAYSTDGLNWNMATMPSSSPWAVTGYGGNKFVAIGGVYTSTNVAAYSTDGITWTETSMPVAQLWTSVCYGNGKFVAISNDSGSGAYSTDGITWTSMTMPSNTYWSVVAYGADKFVALTSRNTAAYSADGITWTSFSMPMSVNWDAICYADGKFVATTHNNIYAAFSTDGINWTTTYLPETSNWSTVTYGNGRFVAISSRWGYAAYSEDGDTWIKTEMSYSDWRCGTFGNGVFVALAYGTNKVAYTTDGTWTNQDIPNVDDALQKLTVKEEGGEEILITLDDIDIICGVPAFTYTVDAIDGASYGFALNNAGYYESQNKGVNSSYAICRINFDVTRNCDIVFDVINYAESSYDYALFGNMDSSLTLSHTADTTNVKQSFKSKQSASVVNVTYSGITAGNHFIDVKFIKDSSQASNNDTVQFKIQ